jgi:hypothetical protein
MANPYMNPRRDAARAAYPRSACLNRARPCHDQEERASSPLRAGGRPGARSSPPSSAQHPGPTSPSSCRASRTSTQQTHAQSRCVAFPSTPNPRSPRSHPARGSAISSEVATRPIQIFSHRDSPVFAGSVEQESTGRVTGRTRPVNACTTSGHSGWCLMAVHWRRGELDTHTNPVTSPLQSPHSPTRSGGRVVPQPGQCTRGLRAGLAPGDS